MTDSAKDTDQGPTDPAKPPPADGITKVNDVPTRDTLPTPHSPAYTYLEAPEAPGELGRLSGYRVLRVLGQGGMGVVFEAEDPVLGRLVAVKVPTALATDESYRKRFLREARIAATLSSDHIATVYQAGQQHGVPFLVMELLRGETLEKCLKRQKTLPASEALRIAREIALGLREAHVHGLVHRDIKPANVWLEQREGRPGPPRVKILDFGVAREAKPEQGITGAGQIVGSLGYMAPEQVFADELDGRTDLFALGCVLYEMLIGDLPFQGADTVASLKAVVYHTPKPVAETAPHLPASVCRLLDDLLQKDRAARPASAETVIERIAEIEREQGRHTVAQPVLPRPTESSGHWKPRGSLGMIFGAGTIVLAVIVGIVVLARTFTEPKPSGDPIKIGVLHSLTGTLAVTEKPVAEATLMAIAEINEAGGVMGRLLEPILVDGGSTEEGFARGAEKLLAEDGVAAIFGCWTSSTRKRVEAICAQHDSLLVYPVNYEGLEDSRYVIYVGGGPNQQLIPALSWAIGERNRRKFFLVGTDYIYSRACNAILKDEMEVKKVEFAGEAYVPMHASSAKFMEVVEKIQESGADAVLSTVDGDDANLAFFHALTEGGINAKETPVISFSFFETALHRLDDRDTIGHYAVANYFESMTNPENVAFLERFRARFPTGVANDPIVTAYTGVYLWKQAVTEAGDEGAAAVRPAMANQKYNGPEGLLAIDGTTRHGIRTARIGEVVNNREFEIVFSSPRPIMPAPFPPTRTRAQWEEFLQGLYKKWGDRWEAPAR